MRISFIKRLLALLAAFGCFLGYIFTGETVWIVLGFAFIVLDGYCKSSKNSKDE
ncbi:MAG: hypothetical protein H9W82_00150 [Lactobacillus sp.]|nr:hypothetical protein [Lactobacillus sp.]